VLADVLHFSFTVSDLARSVAWYVDVLGLELVSRQRQDNDYTRTLVGMPDAVLEVARLKIPGRDPGSSDHLLELVQYVEGAGPRVPLRTNSPGVAHLAFLVDDIEARHQRMADAGVEFRGRPVLITAGTNEGGRVCYFAGPDGETLELLEPSPDWMASADA
jgi:catechol 2,3-dioxygenase-like lactoylglutathione lyase family enzyme